MYVPSSLGTIFCCEASSTSLREAPIHPVDRPMRYVTASSFLGCGTNLYGWRPTPDGRHIVTRWMTILFFPIIPVRSYVIDFTRDGRGASDHVLSMFGFVRDALEGKPLSSICWRQVANSYLYAYLPWVIALSFGPIVSDILSWAMASLILGSWLFAAIMMRRACRRRGSGKTKR